MTTFLPAQNCRVGVGVVILKGEYVLLGLRKVPPYQGSWGCPGGAVENETATDAAIREVFEETGMAVKSLEKLPAWADEGMNTKNGYPFVCVFFRAAVDFNAMPELLEPDKTECWNWHHALNLPEPMIPETKSAVEQAYEMEHGTYKRLQFTEPEKVAASRKHYGLDQR